MTQSQLESTMAHATGESVCLVRHRGFGVASLEARSFAADDLMLVLDCPFCRHRVTYPGLTRNGSPAMAECLGCDVYFDFAMDEDIPARHAKSGLCDLGDGA